MYADCRDLALIKLGRYLLVLVNNACRDLALIKLGIYLLSIYIHNCIETSIVCEPKLIKYLLACMYMYFTCMGASFFTSLIFKTPKLILNSYHVGLKK